MPHLISRQIGNATTATVPPESQQSQNWQQHQNDSTTETNNNNNNNEVTIDINCSNKTLRNEHVFIKGTPAAIKLEIAVIIQLCQ